MKNNDFKEKKFQVSDPIESYFEFISSCDIQDCTCISECVEILKQHENWDFYLFCKLVISVGITFNLINLFFRLSSIFIFLLIPFSLIWLITSEAVLMFLLPTFKMISFTEFRSFELDCSALHNQLWRNFHLF